MQRGPKAGGEEQLGMQRQCRADSVCHSSPNLGLWPELELLQLPVPDASHLILRRGIPSHTC